MGALSVSHWLIVLVVVLLLFGPKKLAGVGKGLGQGIRNFRTGLSEDETTEETDSKQGGAPSTSQVPKAATPPTPSGPGTTPDQGEEQPAPHDGTALRS